MIKNIQYNNTFRSKSQPIIKRDLLRASIISASLLFTVGCNNGSTTSNNQMTSITAQVAKNLKKDLSLIVPDGAGGLVGIYKPKEEAQFITIGRTLVKNGQPVNKDTMSLIGSTSKMFTALTSLRLIELGILNLDSKLSDYMDQKYFEIFEEPEKAKNISLRQLLSHTSGLQYDADCEDNKRAMHTLDEILSEMVQKAKQNPSYKIKFINNPKDRVFSYSNQIWLATIIIQNAYNKKFGTDLTYADILKQAILQPLGMTRTDFERSDNDPMMKETNLLQAYLEAHGSSSAYSYEVKIFDPTIRGAGGLWSTPSDLMKLAKSLSPKGLIAKNGEILISAPLIKEMTTPQGINGNTGLGVYHDFNRVGKGGSMYSYGNSFEIDFDTGNAVIAMVNFREARPLFDRRVMKTAAEELGSKPLPKYSVDDSIKDQLRKIKSQYETKSITDFKDLFVSNYGYIGIIKATAGLIVNWNGELILAGSLLKDNLYMLFDRGERDGTIVRLGYGADSHKPYLFFEDHGDNSQVFLPLTEKDQLPNIKDNQDAFDLVNKIHGSKGVKYKSKLIDGPPPITIKIDTTANKIIAKQDSANFVPILFTKVIRSNNQITEIWFVSNCTAVPDKIFKLIKKDNIWVLYIAIPNNPNDNKDELSPEM